MPTQKWCNVEGCPNFIFATLDDFYKFGWSGFQIPAGRKALCFCPDHHKEMKERMYRELSCQNVRVASFQRKL